LPELRIDPLTGLKTIVAGERANRPGGGFSAEPVAPIDPETDPFLEGHEDRTPPEVYALRPGGGEPDTPGWLVRVVPNLYPALEAGEAAPEDIDPLASGRGEPGFFAFQPAVGAHEVIVNTPKPVTSLRQLEPEEVETAFGVWRERMRTHATSPYVHVIVNEGRDAGASLPHSHSQLAWLPGPPPAVVAERGLPEGEVVVERDGLVARCPRASRVPYEVQIAPERPEADALRSDLLAPALQLLAELIRRIQAIRGEPTPLNAWLHEGTPWHLELLPRTTRLAGLELGASVYINPVAPEEAAAALRGGV
jgi:UDPglucose--hexose-1-phosphate uridylyltransferase